MNVILGCGNKMKINEITRIIKKLNRDDNYIVFTEMVDFPYVKEIQSNNVEEVAINKATQYFNLLEEKCPILVEDTGLKINNVMMQGFPGQYVKDYFKLFTPQQFCNIHCDSPIVAETVFAFHDTKTIKTYRGEIHGAVSKFADPDAKAFDFDYVFKINDYYSPYYGKLLSELTGDQKDEISMRRKALDKFIEDIYKK